MDFYTGTIISIDTQLLCVIFLDRDMTRSAIDLECLKIGNQLIERQLDRQLMVFYIVSICRPLDNHMCFISRGLSEPSLDFIRQIKDTNEGLSFSVDYKSGHINIIPGKKQPYLNTLIDSFEFNRATFSQHNF